MVAAPLLDSSSGWACTAINRSSLNWSLITCLLDIAETFQPSGCPYSSSPSRSIRATGMQNDMIERPAARYGRQRLSRGNRRWNAIALGVAVLAAGVAIAVIGSQRLGTGPVKGELGGYQLVDEQTVQVTITVTRDDPAKAVSCIVRARAID